jgi:hypothetical protein
MLQIKIVQGKDADDLNERVNEFLATVKSDAIHDNIDFDIPNMVAIIKYDVFEEWHGRLCSECKYWDDGESSDSVSGLCQERGCRRRFNGKACKSFKDVRG